MTSTEELPPPYKGRISIVHVGKDHHDQIVVTGTTFSPAEARHRWEAIRLLLDDYNISSPLTALNERKLVLTQLVTDAGFRVYRAIVTDWIPTHCGTVKVLLVDEGQVNLEVGLGQLYSCPAHIRQHKPIYQCFVLADVYPVDDEWSSDTICWIKTELEHKTVDAFFRENNQKVIYISPLGPGGEPFIAVLLAKGKAVTEKCLGKPRMKFLHKAVVDVEIQPAQSFMYSQMRMTLDSNENCHVMKIDRGPWKFYLQFDKQKAKQEEVDEKLHLLVHLKKLEKICPKEGDAVLCFVSQQPCRGLVLKTEANQDITVYCVDKGFTVHKSLDDIWSLPKELLAIPVLTYRCCLHGLPRIEDDEISKKFFALVLDRPILGQVIEYNEKLSTVSLFLNCQSVLLMIMPGHCEELALPDKCNAVISYVHEENAIVYLQLTENQEKLDEMQAKLQESTLRPVEGRIKRGLLCLAKYPEDDMWYRGIVVRARDPLIVHYVDFGNEAAVCLECVKHLDSIRLDLPAQAIPCILNDVNMKPLLYDDIEKVIGGATVNVQVVGNTVVQIGHISRNVPLVEVISNQAKVSVNKHLKQLQLMKDNDSFNNDRQESDVGKFEWKQEEYIVSQENTALSSIPEKHIIRPPVIDVMPKTIKKCKLSCAFTPLNFFLTLLDSEPTIEEMKRIMSEAFDCNPEIKFVENVKKGRLVAVFGKDHFWHRALVIFCDGHKINLFLIDSGMEESVYIHQLRALPDCLLTIPSQALRCSVGNIHWIADRKASDQLKTMINSNFVVHFIDFIGGKWKVELNSDVEHTPDMLPSFSRGKTPFEGKMFGDSVSKPDMQLEKSYDAEPIKPVKKESTRSGLPGWRNVNSESEFGNEVQSRQEYRTSSRSKNDVSDWIKQNVHKSEGKLQNQGHRRYSSSKRDDDCRGKQSGHSNRWQQNENGQEKEFKVRFQKIYRPKLDSWRKTDEKVVRKNQVEYDNWRNVAGSGKESESEYVFQNQEPTTDSLSKKYIVKNWREQNKFRGRLDLENRIEQRTSNFQRSTKYEPEAFSLAHDRQTGHSLKTSTPLRESCRSIPILDTVEESIESRSYMPVIEKPIKVRKSSNEWKEEIDLKEVNRAKISNVFEQGKKTNWKCDLPESKISDDAQFLVGESAILTKLAIPFGMLVDVKVTWVLSPVKFYCQLINSYTSILQAKMKAVQDECNRLSGEEVRYSFTKNQVVMALHTDGMWHRAKIMAIPGRTHTIQFLDSGELRSNLKTSAILPLKKGYAENIPALAIRVMISDLQPSCGVGWSVEATCTAVQKLRRANQCVFEKQFQRSGTCFATKVMVNGESYVDHLLNTGFAVKINHSLGKELNCKVNLDGACGSTTTQAQPVYGKEFLCSSPLVEGGCFTTLSDSFDVKQQHILQNQDAQKTEKKPKKEILGFIQQVPIVTGMEVYLSHAETDGTVWLQRRIDLGVLQKIEEKMNSYVTDCKILEEVVVGMACIVKSIKNSACFRASIQSITDNEIEVYCVDYGHTEFLPFSQVFAIPEELQNILQLSCKCILNLLDSDVHTMNWTLLLRNNSKKVLNVEVLGTCSGMHIVTVTNEGQNILMRLSDLVMQTEWTGNHKVGKVLKETDTCLGKSNNSQFLNNLQDDNVEKMSSNKFNAGGAAIFEPVTCQRSHPSKYFGNEMANQQTRFSRMIVTNPVTTVEESPRKQVPEVSDMTVKEDNSVIKVNKGLSSSLKEFEQQHTLKDKKVENKTKKDNNRDYSESSLIIHETCQCFTSRVPQDKPVQDRLALAPFQRMIMHRSQAKKESQKKIVPTELDTGLDECVVRQSLPKVANKVTDEPHCEHKLPTDVSDSNQCLEIQRKEVLTHHVEKAEPLLSELSLRLKGETLKLLEPEMLVDYQSEPYLMKKQEAKKCCQQEVKDSLSAANIKGREGRAVTTVPERVEGQEGKVELQTYMAENLAKIAPSNTKQTFGNHNLRGSSPEAVSEWLCSRSNIESFSSDQNVQMQRTMCLCDERSEISLSAPDDVLVKEISPSVCGHSHLKLITEKKDVLHQVKSGLNTEVEVIPYTKENTMPIHFPVMEDDILQGYDNKGMTQDFGSLLAKDVKEDIKDAVVYSSKTEYFHIKDYQDIQKENALNCSEEKLVIEDKHGDVCKNTLDVYGEHVKSLGEHLEGKSSCENSKEKYVSHDLKVVECEESKVKDMLGEQQIKAVYRDSHEDVPEDFQGKDNFKDFQMIHVPEDHQQEVESFALEIVENPECLHRDNLTLGLNMFSDIWNKDSSGDILQKAASENTKVNCPGNSQSIDQLDHSHIEDVSKDLYIKDEPTETQRDEFDETFVASTYERTRETEDSLVQDAYGDMTLQCLLEHSQKVDMFIYTDVRAKVKEVLTHSGDMNMSKESLVKPLIRYSKFDHIPDFHNDAPDVSEISFPVFVDSHLELAPDKNEVPHQGNSSLETATLLCTNENRMPVHPFVKDNDIHQGYDIPVMKGMTQDFKSLVFKDAKEDMQDPEVSYSDNFMPENSCVIDLCTDLQKENGSDYSEGKIAVFDKHGDICTNLPDVCREPPFLVGDLERKSTYGNSEEKSESDDPLAIKYVESDFKNMLEESENQAVHKNSYKDVPDDFQGKNDFEDSQVMDVSRDQQHEVESEALEIVGKLECLHGNNIPFDFNLFPSTLILDSSDDTKVINGPRNFESIDHLCHSQIEDLSEDLHIKNVPEGTRKDAFDETFFASARERTQVNESEDSLVQDAHGDITLQYLLEDSQEKDVLFYREVRTEVEDALQHSEEMNMSKESLVKPLVRYSKFDHIPEFHTNAPVDVSEISFPVFVDSHLELASDENDVPHQGNSSLETATLLCTNENRMPIHPFVKDDDIHQGYDILVMKGMTQDFKSLVFKDAKEDMQDPEVPFTDNSMPENSCVSDLCTDLQKENGPDYSEEKFAIHDKHGDICKNLPDVCREPPFLVGDLERKSTYGNSEEKSESDDPLAIKYEESNFESMLGRSHNQAVYRDSYEDVPEDFQGEDDFKDSQMMDVSKDQQHEVESEALEIVGKLECLHGNNLLLDFNVFPNTLILDSSDDTKVINGSRNSLRIDLHHSQIEDLSEDLHIKDLPEETQKDVFDETFVASTYERTQVNESEECLVQDASGDMQLQYLLEDSQAMDVLIYREVRAEVKDMLEHSEEMNVSKESQVKPLVRFSKIDHIPEFHNNVLEDVSEISFPVCVDSHLELAPDENDVPHQGNSSLETAVLPCTDENTIPIHPLVKDIDIHQEYDISVIEGMTQDFNNLVFKDAKEDMQDLEVPYTDNSMLENSCVSDLCADLQKENGSNSYEEKFAIYDKRGDICINSPDICREPRFLVKKMVEDLEGNSTYGNSEEKYESHDPLVMKYEESDFKIMLGESENQDVYRDSYKDVPEDFLVKEDFKDSQMIDVSKDHQHEVVFEDSEIDGNLECLQGNNVPLDFNVFPDSLIKDSFEDTKIITNLGNFQHMDQLDHSQIKDVSEDLNIKDVPGQTQRDVIDESVVTSIYEGTQVSLETLALPCTNENTMPIHPFVKDNDNHQGYDIPVIKGMTEDFKSLVFKDAKEDLLDTEISCTENSGLENSCINDLCTDLQKENTSDYSKEKFAVYYKDGDVCKNSLDTCRKPLAKQLAENLKGKITYGNSEEKYEFHDHQSVEYEESQFRNKLGESQMQAVYRDAYENVPEDILCEDDFKNSQLIDVPEDHQEEVDSEALEVVENSKCMHKNNLTLGLISFSDTLIKDSSEDLLQKSEFEDTRFIKSSGNSHYMDQLDYSQIEDFSEDFHIKGLPEEAQKDVFDKSLDATVSERTQVDESEGSLVQNGTQVYESKDSLVQDGTQVDESGSLVQGAHRDMQLKNLLRDSQEMDMLSNIDMGHVCEDIPEVNVSRNLRVFHSSEDSCLKNELGEADVLGVPEHSQVMDLSIELPLKSVLRCSKMENIPEDSEVMIVPRDLLLDDAPHYFPLNVMTTDAICRHPSNRKCTRRAVPSEDTLYNQGSGLKQTNRSEDCGVKLKSSTLGFKGLKPQKPLTIGTAVYISCIEEKERLWLQRACDSNILQNLALRISASLASVKVPSNLKEGMVCLAQSNEDHLWYRAVILNILESDVLVHFIDYGNSEFISMKQIRDIQDDILNERQLSYGFRLKINNVSQENTSLISMLDAYWDKELMMAYVDTNELETFTLTCDTQNILDGYGILEFISFLEYAGKHYPVNIQEGQKFSKEGSNMQREHLYREMHSESSKNRERQLRTKKGLKIPRLPRFMNDGSDMRRKQMCVEEEFKVQQEDDNMSDDHSVKVPVWKGTKEKLIFMTAPFADILNDPISSHSFSETSSEKKEIHVNVNEKCKLKKCLQVEAPLPSEVDIRTPVIGLVQHIGRPTKGVFIPCKGDEKFRSSLHAIEEVEESEAFGITEVEVNPYNAFLVHVEDFPFSLWVQREEDIDLAEFVEHCLQELGDDLQLVEVPRINQLCISLLCGCRQRVQVTALSDSNASVHYIDQGRYGVVSQKELWKLQDELNDIPPLATQVFLPVTVLPERKSDAALAVTEAAFHSMCACLDLNQLGPSSKMKYTLFSVPGVGDLGNLLVNGDFAMPRDWEKEIGLHMASIIKKKMEEAVNVLHNDQLHGDSMHVAAITSLAEKIDKLTLVLKSSLL